MSVSSFVDKKNQRGETDLQAAKEWTITMEGGVSFPCGSSDTLLRAALRQGIGFPYECNSGGCGSCIFELQSGAMDEVWESAPGLSAAAREKGLLLACQCIPYSDCTIKVRARSQYVPPVIPARQNALLENVIPLTHDMSLFRFRGTGSARFLPGQYAMLSLPEQPHT